MLSILSLDAPAERVRVLPHSPAPGAVPAVTEQNPETKENEGDFELVLGRTQVAGVLFVAVVILVVFSAVSYLAGKALAPKAAVAPVPAAVETPAPVTAPVLEATIVKPPPPPVEVPEPPMFADPAQGGLYLQIGAVEKGVAIIMADGLRKRGFHAFVAPGPAENIFRVLLGPVPENGFREIRQKVDQIGLNTFVKKYQP